MVVRGAGILLAVSIALGGFAADATTISVDTRNAPNPASNVRVQGHTLRITGMFTPGDADRLRDILASLKRPAPRASDSPAVTELSFVTVELSSAGGDLVEGFKVGYLFAEFGVATVVRKGDTCLSACALAFLGGTSANFGGASSSVSPLRNSSCRVEIGGTLGFHNFSAQTDALLRNSASEDGSTSERHGFYVGRAGASYLVTYAADMGIDQKFVAQLLSRATASFDYLETVRGFLALRVCPIGLDRPKISLAEQATNICNHSTNWLTPVTSALVLPIDERQAKRNLLEYVQSSMLSFKVKGALSDQLASTKVMRDRKGIDALYADLSAAGLPLLDVVGPIFEVSGYQMGGNNLQCMVSISPEDPDKYSAVIKGPTGITHAFASAPEGCRQLFLFDRETDINPKR